MMIIWISVARVAESYQTPCRPGLDRENINGKTHKSKNGNPLNASKRKSRWTSTMHILSIPLSL
jgi:hypothetical protein